MIALPFPSDLIIPYEDIRNSSQILTSTKQMKSPEDLGNFRIAFVGDDGKNPFLYNPKNTKVIYRIRYLPLSYLLERNMISVVLSSSPTYFP